MPRICGAVAARGDAPPVAGPLGGGAPGAADTDVKLIYVESRWKIACSCGPVTLLRPRVPTTWALTTRGETPRLVTVMPSSRPLTRRPSLPFAWEIVIR